MKAFIYRWTNNENSMKYIGSHIGEIDDGYVGSGKYFRSAYNKNPNVFTREILEIIEGENIEKEIIKREEHYLKKYDVSKDSSYYNITNRYFGGDVYSGLSELDKRSISKKASERSKEDRKNNPEKYRLACIKMSNSKRKKALIVNRFDIDGIFINSYSCIEEAYEKTRISKGNIYSVLNGKRNIAGGFRWSYTNNVNPIIKKNKGRPRGSKNKKNIIRNHINLVTLEILQYDLSNNLIKIWSSGKEAANYLGISEGSINHFVNGRIPKSGNYKGFIWRKGNLIKSTVYNNK